MSRTITAEMYETLTILDKVGLANSEINAIVGIRLFSTEEPTVRPQPVESKMFGDLVEEGETAREELFVPYIPKK